jgi:hypothetical protein
MLQRTNVFPTDAMSWARTVIATGDIDGSVMAANFLARAEKINATGITYADDDQLKAYVGQVNAGISAGAPADAAVQDAFRNTYQTTDAERKAYTAMYSDKLKGPQKAFSANSGDLQNRLDSDDRYDQSIFGGAPTPSAGLQADFNSGVERYFPLSGGNLEAARNLAWRDVQRKWGYSTINGKPELLPYAPEVMYPQIPAALIQEDKAAVATGLGIDPANMRIIMSPDTAATGGLEWNIGKVNEFGTVDVVLGPDKRPYRYAIPTDTKKITEARDAQAKAKIDEAREYSRKSREMNERIRKEYATTGDTDLDAWLIAHPQGAQ